tara:strand:+ start:5216 stop:6106 length:891 start_codon:yes stop_codon:yes gene_type:complete
MFTTKSNCAKCIDIYEKGLRNEPRFRESLKKLTSKEKSFINNRIRGRRKIIHKNFTTIFRDEAGTMLSVIEDLANKEKMTRMGQQVHLRDGQELMNKWGKTRTTQGRLKKYRRNNAAKKIQTMFKKTRKYRKKQEKKRSPTMSKKLDKYQQKMLDVLGADNENYNDPEDIAFYNISSDSLDTPPSVDHSDIFKPSEYSPTNLTKKEKSQAYTRNLENIEKYRKKKSNSQRSTERLSQFRDAKEGNTSGDSKSPKQKTSWFGNWFASKKKGGKRTRKRRKRKRTRKRRKRRRRKTRK